MSLVQAWQHIYTNVEKEQSPQGRGGFQTLFHTRSGLTEIEIEEIEARLLYYPSESQPVKRLFFATTTGKLLLAQVVDLSQSDRAGRQGRYLAHALAFAPDTFVHVASDILRVFSYLPFVTSVEEALERGDFATGDIPPATVEIPEAATHGRVEASGHWPVDELKRLALLGLRAEEFSGDRLTVALIGDTQDVANALAAALLAAPSDLVCHCTFDTYFYRCNPVALYYWAVGLPESSGSPRYIEVDTRSHRVVGKFDQTPSTAYERWVLETIDAEDVTFLVRNKNMAFRLCQWLEQHVDESPQLDTASLQVIESVFQANPQQVRGRLHTKLAEQTSTALGSRILDDVYSASTASELWHGLRTGFQLRRLLDFLHESYAVDRFVTPSLDEVNAVGRAVACENHRAMRLLHACWSKQHETLHEELEVVNEEEYRQFTQTAIEFNIIEPLSLLVGGRGEAFLDVYLDAKLPEPINWASLTEALVHVGEVRCLPRLIPLVVGKPHRGLCELTKTISELAECPQNAPALPALLDLLYEGYAAQGFCVPESEEVERIRAALERYAHRPMRLLHACWSRQDDRLQQELANLSEDEYRRFAETAMDSRIVDPSSLVVRGKGGTLVGLLNTGRIRKSSFVSLTEAFLRTGETDCLLHLVPFVPERPPRELRELTTIIRQYANVPEEFATELSKAERKPPSSEGVFGIMKKLLGRSHDR
ncbi:hypothetical protein ACFL5Q_03185 [Planctomycetota bacterium]